MRKATCIYSGIGGASRPLRKTEEAVALLGSDVVALVVSVEPIPDMKAVITGIQHCSWCWQTSLFLETVLLILGIAVDLINQ